MNYPKMVYSLTEEPIIVNSENDIPHGYFKHAEYMALKEKADVHHVEVESPSTKEEAPKVVRRKRTKKVK